MMMFPCEQAGNAALVRAVPERLARRGF